MHLVVRLALTVATAAVLSAAASGAQAQDHAVRSDTDGYVTPDSIVAEASYKRQVEAVEFGSRELSAQLTSAAESQVGSPAAGGSEVRARSSVSTLPGCYNHVVASDGGTLRYGHICPGYGGHLGGRTSELFGISEIVLRDPVTGEVTDVVPVDELTGGTAPTITVSSALLAQFALADLALPSPLIGMSPEGDHVTQLPSWLWIDRQQWRPRDRTASAGPVSATVTASPLRVEWDMGNGDTVTCDGPGRVYEARFAGRPEATNCRYTYRHSSAARGGAAYDVTATVVWRARWSGSDGGGGGLGELTSQATVPVRVGEVQALVQ